MTSITRTGNPIFHANLEAPVPATLSLDEWYVVHGALFTEVLRHRENGNNTLAAIADELMARIGKLIDSERELQESTAELEVKS